MDTDFFLIVIQYELLIRGLKPKFQLSYSSVLIRGCSTEVELCQFDISRLRNLEVPGRSRHYHNFNPRSLQQACLIGSGELIRLSLDKSPL
jgi:hypothetical protein